LLGEGKLKFDRVWRRLTKTPIGRGLLPLKI
jgi:hypothetical protein